MSAAGASLQFPLISFFDEGLLRIWVDCSDRRDRPLLHKAQAALCLYRVHVPTRVADVHRFRGICEVNASRGF